MDDPMRRAHQATIEALESLLAEAVAIVDRVLDAPLTDEDEVSLEIIRAVLDAGRDEP